MAVSRSARSAWAACLSIEDRPGAQRSIATATPPWTRGHADRHGRRLPPPASEAVTTPHTPRATRRGKRRAVATKGGHSGRATGSWTVDGPPHLREAAEASLKAPCGRHRPLPVPPPRPAVPRESGPSRTCSTWRGAALRHLNATVGQIDTARRILGPGNRRRQNEFSPGFGPARRTAALCPPRHRVPALEPARRQRPGYDPAPGTSVPRGRRRAASARNTLA